MALELEGIIPDLLQPLDWLVEIADDEKDRDKRRNSEHRVSGASNSLQTITDANSQRQGPLSNNEQAERKMKKKRRATVTISHQILQALPLVRISILSQ